MAAPPRPAISTAAAAPADVSAARIPIAEYFARVRIPIAEYPIGGGIPIAEYSSRIGGPPLWGFGQADRLYLASRACGSASNSLACVGLEKRPYCARLRASCEDPPEKVARMPICACIAEGRSLRASDSSRGSSAPLSAAANQPSQRSRGRRCANPAERTPARSAGEGQEGDCVTSAKGFARNLLRSLQSLPQRRAENAPSVKSRLMSLQESLTRRTAQYGAGVIRQQPSKFAGPGPKPGRRSTHASAVESCSLRGATLPALHHAKPSIARGSVPSRPAADASRRRLITDGVAALPICLRSGFCRGVTTSTQSSRDARTAAASSSR